jgi:hypothetical protein
VVDAKGCDVVAAGGLNTRPLAKHTYKFVGLQYKKCAVERIWRKASSICVPFLAASPLGTKTSYHDIFSH